MTNPTAGPTDPKPARRPLRLSVRAAMVTVLILAVVLGWLVNRAQIQRQAIAAIRASGGGVAYDFQRVPGKPNNPRAEPNAPRWLVRQVGVDYFGTVVAVMLGPRATDLEMEHVGRLPGVRSLNAPTAIGITDAGAAQLAGLAGLETINLSGTKVTGASLAHFEGLTRLKGLSVIGQPIADADLARLEGLTALETLYLSRTKVTDDGLAHLQGLVNLKQLWLNETRVAGPGLIHLRRLRSLEGLSLNRSRIGDLSTLPRLPALKELRLDGTPVDDAQLAEVAKLPALAELSLRDVPITDAGLAHLAGAKGSLQSLFLGGTQVTDDGVPALLQLVNLQILDLGKTSVGDPGFERLAALDKLTYMNTIDTAATEEGNARLKKAHPLLNLANTAPAVRNRRSAPGRPTANPGPNP